MNEINKENIESFMRKYFEFHDSNLININYDIYKEKIEMDIELFWELQENGNYERSIQNIKMIFENVKKCEIKECFSWDFIAEAYMKYMEFEDFGEMVCFASNKEDPLFYIVCEKIKYEKIDKLEKKEN